MLQPLRPYYTPQEYLFMERQADYKSEYYNGQIYTMSGGTDRHSRVAVNLMVALDTAFLDRDCLVYNSDMRLAVVVSLTEQFLAYPDVSVVCGEVIYYDEKRDVIRNPIAIMEVLSPSTRNYDRSVKFERYRHLASLQVYIIVDPERVFIEYYHKLENNTWNLQTIEDMTAILNIEPLDVQIPVVRIYNKLRLPPES
jgi:Uma2 family endonuclease